MSVWTETVETGATVLWVARSASHGWRSSREALGRSLGTLRQTHSAQSPVHARSPSPMHMPMTLLPFNASTSLLIA